MTRLYFHNATSTLANLPTDEQSSLTPNNSPSTNPEARTINRTMNTTIGTGQVAKALTSNANTSAQNYYFTRFVSPELDSSITSITAQTWGYSMSTNTTNASSNFPVSGGPQTGRACCYVWRPSTQTKLGTIRDGTTASNILEAAVGQQYSDVTTFTGALVSGVQQGDVIIFELWAVVTQSSSGSYTDTFYYDGTLIPTDDAQETNVATYIETPQNLVFVIPPIVMTQVTALTYSNKFITAV